jgi:hypothetical protein
MRQFRSCATRGLAVSVSVILSLAGGCSSERGGIPDEDGRCRLSQSLSEHTLPSGFFEPGTVLGHAFRIFNDTGSVVRFGPVRTSCSCATAELSRSEVLPGEETVLRMSLRLTKASGRRSAHCVLGNDNGESWQFRISATSYPLMEFADGGSHTYVHIGTFLPGDAGSSTVDVFAYAEPNDPLPSIEISTDPGTPLQAELEGKEDDSLPDGFERRRARVRLQLPRQTKPGLHKASIAVGCRSDKASQTGKITAIWQVKSLYSVAPERIGLGLLDEAESQKIRRKVVVKRVDGKPIGRIDALSSDPGITVEGPISLFSGNAEELTIVVDTAAIAGSLCEEVSIDTHDRVQSPIVVPVVGFR